MKVRFRKHLYLQSFVFNLANLISICFLRGNEYKLLLTCSVTMKIDNSMFTFYCLVLRILPRAWSWNIRWSWVSWRWWYKDLELCVCMFSGRRLATDCLYEMKNDVRTLLMSSQVCVLSQKILCLRLCNKFCCVCLIALAWWDSCVCFLEREREREGRVTDNNLFWYNIWR